MLTPCIVRECRLAISLSMCLCVFYGLTASPSAESDPTIQLGDQDIRIMEASGLHDLHGGKSIGVFKVLQRNSISY
jgi:hypothetical protein